MKLSRREFGKRTSLGLLFAALGAPLFTSGCNVVSSLIAYIPWITRALNAITSILGSFMPPGATVIINIIVAALADLQAALVEYQADPVPTDKDTLLHKIETFLKDITQNFQQFLDAMAVNGPIASVVLGIIQVVLSTLGWFAMKFAAITNRPLLPMAKPMSLRAQNQMLYIVPAQRSLKQFKHDFNQIAYSNGHPEVWMY
jgi:hypothetical protein